MTSEEPLVALRLREILHEYLPASQAQEKCLGLSNPSRKACYQFIPGNAASDVVPKTIVIARSSTWAHKGWAMGTGSVEAGLPLWVDIILREYAHFAGGGLATALLHASSHTQTRFLPGPKHDDSTKESRQSVHFNKRKAYIVSKAVLTDIKAANKAGKTPTILSVDLDAFTCNTEKLAEWFEANRFKEGLGDIRRSQSRLLNSS